MTDGNKQTAIHSKLNNDQEGIDTFFKSLSKVPDFSLDKCLICIEATGVYMYPLLTFAAQNDAHVWMESGTQIKKSMGIQRGKNDKVDALRIASYAFKNQEDTRLWKPANPTITQIKHLTALRDRLIKSQKQLSVPVEEFRQVGDTKMAKLLAKSMKTTMDALQKDIHAIDQQIKELLEGDSDLKTLFKLVTSVVGIGKQTAIAFLVYTDGFTLFDDARKLACYAGVAPFEYSSGTSVRGKTRVSKMANMNLKALLHMASISAIQHDFQLKAYYERKVAEGKKKMSILNAVKAKLIHRVMSVVQRKTKYENSQKFSLVLS
jgi:transposase